MALFILGICEGTLCLAVQSAWQVLLSTIAICTCVWVAHNGIALEDWRQTILTQPRWQSPGVFIGFLHSQYDSCQVCPQVWRSCIVFCVKETCLHGSLHVVIIVVIISAEGSFIGDAATNHFEIIVSVTGHYQLGEKLHEVASASAFWLPWVKSSDDVREVPQCQYCREACFRAFPIGWESAHLMNLFPFWEPHRGSTISMKRWRRPIDLHSRLNTEACVWVYQC